MSSYAESLEARIRELEGKLGRTGSQWASARPVWCVETGQKFASIRSAAKENDISITQLSNAANHRQMVRTAGGFHWSLEEPTTQTSAMANLMTMAQSLSFPVMRNRMDDKTRETLSDMAKLIAAALAMLLIACLPANVARGSIVYDVHLDTSALPAGDYQAAFFLIDPAAPDNFSQAKLPVSFSIDGDIISDSTHYYADQPTLDPVPVPEPINFYLTLNGSTGSSDYFLMAVRTPDGGMLAAPDGSEWLAWAKMDVNSPTLNLDLPDGARISSVVVPEPLPAMMMFCGISYILLRRRRAA